MLAAMKKTTDAVGPIGRELRRLREEKKLTQDALAGLAGVTRLTISNIENGKTEEPKRKVLEAVAAALEVPPERLRGEASPRTLDTHPSVSVPGSTLAPGQRRPPGLEGWLAAHKVITERELWNLDRWVAQDALNPNDPGYWDEVLQFVRKRIASRGGSGGGTPSR